MFPHSLPLTPRQRLIWVEEALSHRLPLNSVTTLLEIRGELNRPALAQAFDLLVARHDALRMSLPDTHVLSFRPLPSDKPCRLELVDLDGADPGAAFDRWLAGRLRKPWALDGPLFDLALVRRAAADHVLVVNRHHIVSDNASSIALHEELDVLYRHCANHDGGTALSLAPAPSYADYLSAEALEAAATGVSAETVAFWAGRQASKPPALRFYGGSPSVTAIGYRRVSAMLDEETSLQIDRLGRPAVVSVVLLSVLFAFLRRVTGETDLSVGMPLHNRTAATRGMIGLIMDICPTRITVEAADTFNDLVRKVRQELAEIRPHRRHTVSSNQAGYEVLFNFLPDVPASFAGHEAHYVHATPLVLLDDLDVADIGETALHSREKLTVTMQRGAGASCYEIHLDFNRSILPSGMPADRAGDHFLAMLRAFLRDAGQSIDSIDILTADERARLLDPVASLAPSPSASRTVVDMFRARAVAAPHREAVVGSGMRLTYGELDEHVRTLTGALRAAGARPGSIVAVCVDRTPRMVVALLAVLSAGAAYVPIDPAYPPDRIDLIFDDVMPTVAISERAVRDRLGERRQERVICLDDVAETAHVGARNAENETAPAPDDLAYVIYTSGSTGRPKGVAITHAQLAGFLEAIGERIGISADDRVLASTTIAFDPMIVEVFLPLVAGACVVVAPQAVTIDGHALGCAIDDQGITIVQGAPATYRMLLSAGWQGRAGLTLLCGAEVLSTSLAASLLDRAGAVWNLYGPTETTVWATTHRVTRGDSPVVPIGSPLPGSRIYVLNDAHVPVPIGVPGEIHIGGPRVAHGYHARPELTQDRFLTDPFSVDGSATLYRTGDFGRLREDLDLEFIGRIDNQVKVRGVRVELEEIEAVITQYDGVTGACVTPFVDASGETSLSAHAEYGGGPAVPDTQGLMAFLRQRLPKYMMPARVVMIERLPKSPTGKVDRAAVAATAGTAPPVNTALGVQPGSALEADMLAVWQRVLQAPHLGVTHDFFDAGGHSLLAINLMLEIEQGLGIPFSLERVFKTPTVRTLCDSLGDTVVPRPVIVMALTKTQRSDTLCFVHGRGQFLPIAEALEDAIASVSVLPNGTTWLRELVGDGRPFDAISRISRAYADAILSGRRGGHLYLVGHSFGGSLMIETACHLEERGAPPRCVFLLDTVLRRDARSDDSPARPLDARVDARNHAWAPALDALRDAGARSYRGPSRPLSSPVVLFRATGKSIAAGSVEEDVTQGWGKHFGRRLTVIAVPGDHLTLLQPAHAGAIATWMRAYVS